MEIHYNPSQFTAELNMNPTVQLQIEYAALLFNWGKQVPEKTTEAFKFVIGVETDRSFPRSLDWYNIMFRILTVSYNLKVTYITCINML